uniref:TSUP family transporter n=1 Tax=Actinomadura roseirufa TaxID=2094049 RepID=UPI0013F15731
LARILLAGLVVGLLTGLFGVGGGFVIVPALVLALRLPAPAAVGTSLLVIAVDSAASLAARGGGGHVDWALVLPFTAAAMAGALAGRRAAGRLPAALLTRSFAVLLLAVAGCVAVTGGAALA